MPCILIETRGGWLQDRSAELFDRIDAALVAVLKVPASDSLIRLRQYDEGELRLPGHAGPRHTLVQVALFAGRSGETKAALSRALTGALLALGVPAADVIVALQDVPLENWGIGGRPGTEIAFGFDIAI
jgi:phenylpyruvate tautomerase PptA (4-oxalocrotonate tautomerase family)